MKANQRLSQSVELRNRLKVDPKVVVSSRILQLPQQELEKAIDQELNDNPALERVEAEGHSDENELAQKFMYGQKPVPAEDFESFAARAGSPEDLDWLDFVAAPESLHDYILAQLLAQVEPDLHTLAHHVVDCVNDSGYLDIPIEEIALLASADIDEVASVVQELHKCDPPGVGATNLQECLEIQLSEFEDRISTIARAIVKRHWEDLVQKRPRSIANKYRLPIKEVEQAFARIASLTPYPGEVFRATANRGRSTPSASVVPDVMFRRDGAGIRIDVKGCEPGEFFVNAWYREEFRKQSDTPVNTDEKKHVREFVGRAVNFIKAIHQRRRTLRRIAEFLLKEQHGFVSTGSYEFLKPLTRLQVAQATGMHESTVSRATMKKFAQIANGEVIPFEVFFKPALRVQKMIEELLSHENPSSPMSDREISEFLKQRGIQVARRTVNKYREQIRALSSHRRRIA